LLTQETYIHVFIVFIAITYVSMITSLISMSIHYLEYYYPKSFSHNDASLK